MIVIMIVIIVTMIVIIAIMIMIIAFIIVIIVIMIVIIVFKLNPSGLSFVTSAAKCLKDKRDATLPRFKWYAD